MRNFLIPFVMLGALTGCSSELFNQESYCLVEVERDGFDHMTVADFNQCSVPNDDNEIYYDTAGKFKIGDVVYSISDVETQRHNPVKVVPVPVTTPALPRTTTATTVTTTTSSSTTTVLDPAKVKTVAPKKRR